MLATNLSEADGTETKLRMAFKIYDKDSSGELDFFVKILKIEIIFRDDKNNIQGR